MKGFFSNATVSARKIRDRALAAGSVKRIPAPRSGAVAARIVPPVGLADAPAIGRIFRTGERRQRCIRDGARQAFEDLLAALAGRMIPQFPDDLSGGQRALLGSVQRWRRVVD
jgi:hypothetical protein